MKVRPRSTKNSLPGRRRLLSALPHSWHSCHWFIDDTGLCAARACTETCDFQKGVVPSARFNQAESNKGPIPPSMARSLSFVATPPPAEKPPVFPLAATTR